MSEAVSNSYINLELDHFDEESKNIIKSYFDNDKLHYEDFMKDISTEEERLKLLNRSINSFFNSVENNFSTWREKQNINAKEQLYQILGRSFSKHRATSREENLNMYLCPLIGEYVSQMPEFKPIADKMLNILEKQKEYITEWTKNHFDAHIIFNEQETEVYRYNTPEREISLLTNNAGTLENKVELLDKIEMMDFNKSESIQEFKEELYDLSLVEKRELIKKGKYIEEFLRDADDDTRRVLIENKYGKNKFINTDKWRIALELVENFGYENLRYKDLDHRTFPDNINGEVSEAIAKQGWGLDVYINDKRPWPQRAAEEWLKDNNMAIDQYIEKYPERCYIFENRYKKEIEERKAIAKMACEKMDDVKDRITEQQEKEHLAVQSQIK